MDGVVVVDKSQGWTSHDAVSKMRRLAGTKKVGHLGTLDPLATGVLPLVLGRATRLAQFYMHCDKTYEAVIRFGYSTDTYDREGTPTSAVTDPVVDAVELENHLSKYRGAIQQTPPAISAKKVGGTPAYRLTRRNVAVELKPVEVTIYSFELISCEGSLAKVVVSCSGGTYLRSIAHDLGRDLGCGAFIQDLRRTASGDFTLQEARTIEELETLAKAGRLEEALLPMAQLLPQFPPEVVDLLTAGQIRQGRDFRLSPFRERPPSRYVRALDPNGELVAIGEAKLPHLYHPMLVF